MRYISEIKLLTDGKVVPYFIYDMWDLDTEPFSVKVTDTESGETWEIPGREVPYSNLHGFSNDIGGPHVVCVSSRRLDVKLYDYMDIELVKDVPYGQACSITLKRSGFASSAFVDGMRNVIIDIQGYSIKLCDRVVIRQFDHMMTKYVYNMYGVLGWLCKEAGMCLMSFDNVYLCSRLLDIKYKLTFKHTGEADRFFTKMYMDVMR